MIWNRVTFGSNLMILKMIIWEVFLIFINKFVYTNNKHYRYIFKHEFKYSKLRDESTFNLYLCFLIVSYDVT